MESSEKKMPGLTDKQKKFIDEYTAQGFTNAVDAARKAGYSSSSLKANTQNLLSNAAVQKELAKRKGDCSAAAVINGAYVLTKLKEVVEVNSALVAVRDSETDLFVEDKFGNTVYKMVDASAVNAALKTLTTALGLGKEKDNKDQVIADLASTITGMIGR